VDAAGEAQRQQRSVYSLVTEILVREALKLPYVEDPRVGEDERWYRPAG